MVVLRIVELARPRLVKLVCTICHLVRQRWVERQFRARGLAVVQLGGSSWNDLCEVW